MWLFHSTIMIPAEYHRGVLVSGGLLGERELLVSPCQPSGSTKICARIDNESESDLGRTLGFGSCYICPLCTPNPATHYSLSSYHPTSVGGFSPTGACKEAPTSLPVACNSTLCQNDLCDDACSAVGQPSRIVLTSVNQLWNTHLWSG